MGGTVFYFLLAYSPVYRFSSASLSSIVSALAHTCLSKVISSVSV